MRKLEEYVFNALGPIVANRVHPVVVPQSATFPCIRYATTSAVPENSTCGSSKLVRSTLQIDIYSQDFSTVRGLRESVVEAMQAFPLACILTGEMDGFEDEPKLFRRMLLYRVAEQEGP